MDGLSEIRCRTECGCTMGGRMINHLMYADDLVILSHSAKGPVASRCTRGPIDNISFGPLSALRCSEYYECYKVCELYDVLYYFSYAVDRRRPKL